MTSVLVVSGYYPPTIVGGGDISTQIMAEALAEAGASVRVLTCAKEQSTVERNNVSIDYVKSPNLYWRYGNPKSLPRKAGWHLLENYNPRTERLLTSKIQSLAPDLVLTSTLENFGTSVWTAAARLGVPTIHIIRSFYLQCWRGSRFRNDVNCVTRCVDCKLVSEGKKRASQTVSGVIGISDNVLQAHLSGGYFKNARPMRIFNAINQMADLPRSRPGQLTFGYLGALQPSKGIESLVRVFAESPGDSRLLIAGKGNADYLSLLRGIADPRTTEFLGWTDPEELFRRIDFLIFPSLWNEPFGRGIAEAMGHAVPVIGATRGGIPELIADGRNGILYDPDGIGGIKEAIDRATASDYVSLSRGALHDAERFSKSLISGQYLDFINDVIATKALTARTKQKPFAARSPGRPKPRRLLILSGNYPPNIVGGGEIATQILAKGFAERGFDVSVLTCGEEVASRRDGEVAVASVPSPNIYWRYQYTKPGARPRSTLEKGSWQLLDNYNPRSVRAVRQAITHHRPDILLTSILENFGASAWVAAHQAKVPVVDVIHSYYPQCIWASRFRQGRNCGRICATCRYATLGKRYLSKYVNGVVGVSRHILKAHIEEGYYPNARHTVIYNPVALKTGEPRHAHLSDRPTFGYLGKLLPTKGIEELIRGFVSGAIKGQLVVAGDGDPGYEQHLRTIASTGPIEFLGWVAPDTLLDRIDFLVFPSLWNEPFGRGVAEAMGRGVPVIGARRGGIAEQIDHERDGFLFDPAIPGDFARVVQTALHADYGALSTCALRKSKIFESSAIVTRFTEFLEEVVSDEAATRGKYAQRSFRDR